MNWRVGLRTSRAAVSHLAERSDEVVSGRIPRRTANEIEGPNGSERIQGARRSIATTTVCHRKEPLFKIHLVAALPASILRAVVKSRRSERDLKQYSGGVDDNVQNRPASKSETVPQA